MSCRCEEQCLGGGVARSESLNGGGGKHDVRSHVCLTYIGFLDNNFGKKFLTC